MIIAVDFDGTLCENQFPKIGKQTFNQKVLMNKLIELRKNGNKIILWTNRGDNQNYKSLSQAILWCKQRGLQFDSINKNLSEQKKLSGYSPKIMADMYIDDKAYGFSSFNDILNTLRTLQRLTICK